MVTVATFSTQAAAEARQAECLTAHLAARAAEGTDYCNQTTRWSDVITRLDGNYDIYTCPNYDHSTAGDTISEYQRSNYVA